MFSMVKVVPSFSIHSSNIEFNHFSYDYFNVQTTLLVISILTLLNKSSAFTQDNDLLIETIGETDAKYER